MITRFVRGATTLSGHGAAWIGKLAKNLWPRDSGSKVETPPVDGPMTLHPLWYNLPGPNKRPDDSERAIAGAALVRSGSPTVFGMNELVGPGRNSARNAPSPFAKKVLAALGPSYDIIVPTTEHNENYLFFERRSTCLLKRYPDLKVHAKVGKISVPGRHLTVAVLRDLASGRPFVFGVTHLVSGDEWPAGRAAQGVLIMAELSRISARHGDAPIVVGGDMNQADDIAAFIAGGLVNMRNRAAFATNAQIATYSNFNNETIGVQPEWIIDQGYCPSTWTVNSYAAILGLDPSGRFPKPRPSDHVPILFSATGS